MLAKPESETTTISAEPSLSTSATTGYSARVLALRGTLISKEILVRVHPDVARMLQREERGVLEEIEHELAVGIILQADAKLHHSSFDILEV